MNNLKFLDWKSLFFRDRVRPIHKYLLYAVYGNAGKQMS